MCFSSLWWAATVWAMVWRAEADSAERLAAVIAEADFADGFFIVSAGGVADRPSLRI